MSHLILNGFMATGKSTVGAMAAKRLGLPFVDLDDAIERKAGLSTREIFDTHGESRFRQLEHEALKEVLAESAMVIATGGGALQDDNNREQAEARGQVITLTCPVPELVRRMDADGVELRPLLRQITDSGGDRLDRIAELLEARSWLYDVYPAVDTSGVSPDLAADAVVSLFHGIGQQSGGSSYALRFPDGHETRVDFAPIREITANGFRGKRACIITDQTVGKLHGNALANALPTGVTVSEVRIPVGESAKSLETLSELYHNLQAACLDRESTLVALGGGVVCDLAGFAASTFLRGLRLVTVPSTLLAQADASIGGKTGIDFGGAKNLIGSFYPAERVVVNPEILQTLTDQQLRRGLAEILKIGIVRDVGLLQRLLSLSSVRDICDCPDIIRRAIRNKIEVVTADPFERTGTRALLNFGHTIGHGLESLSGYSRAHGDCIAIGMAIEARVSHRLGHCDQDAVEQILSALSHLGLPSEMPRVDPRELLTTMRQDKKRTSDSIRMIMIKRVGDAELLAVDENDILAVVESLL